MCSRPAEEHHTFNTDVDAVLSKFLDATFAAKLRARLSGFCSFCDDCAANPVWTTTGLVHDPAARLHVPAGGRFAATVKRAPGLAE